MSDYKLANYMIALPMNDGYIVFHTIYGYLDMITADLYDMLRTEKFSEIKSDTLKFLIEHNFVIPDEMDENQLLNQYEKAYEENRSHEKNCYIIFRITVIWIVYIVLKKIRKEEN